MCVCMYKKKKKKEMNKIVTSLKQLTHLMKSNRSSHSFRLIGYLPSPNIIDKTNFLKYLTVVSSLEGKVTPLPMHISMQTSARATAQQTTIQIIRISVWFQEGIKWWSEVYDDDDNVDDDRWLNDKKFSFRFLFRLSQSQPTSKV